ncbi:MAG: CotH kinase family protein [Treponema sp.]|jgi:hypothetical protein|nr:CotH kinase family protein [Treponema sp.]
MKKAVLIVTLFVLTGLFFSCTGVVDGPEKQQEQKNDDETEKQITAPPGIHPAAGTVVQGTEISFSSGTDGAEIYYTLDGSAPDRESFRYGSPFEINSSVTIKAIAVKDGWIDSEILEAVYTVTKGPDEALAGKLLILQAYGTGSKTDGAVSHSFVEIYNKFDEPVSLDGVSLQYSSGGTVWKFLDLSGKTIPAESSFLVLGKKMNASGKLQLTENGADTVWQDGAEPVQFNNNAFKIVLIEAASAVNIANPFNIDGAGTKSPGYIDMLGSNDSDEEESIDGTETKAPYSVSKQKSVRRKNLNDTDNNDADFEAVDWRRRAGDNTEKDEDFDAFRPKNTAYGKWNPVHSTGEGGGDPEPPPPPVPPDFAVNAGLPILNIGVPVDTIASRGQWYPLDGGTYNYTLYDTDGRILSASTAQVKGRGNSTWNANYYTNGYQQVTVNKKPYSIKLTSKTKMLEMPKHKRWNLMANLFDKTLIRNDAGLFMGNVFDKLPWTARTEQVALYFNGQFNGVYGLTEAIKIDENRVNIAELSVDNPGGGFIVEVFSSSKTNSGDDPAYFFTTTRINGPLSSGFPSKGFSISEPDSGLTTEIINSVKTKVQKLEDKIYTAKLGAADDYSNYIDVDSLIDWYLVMEISKNPDANFLASVYLYYDPARGKFFMGPVWDFDLAFGNAWHYSATSGQPYDFHIKVTSSMSSSWIPELFRDTEFSRRVRERYQAKRGELGTRLLAFIDERAASMQAAQQRNFEKFNIMNARFWNWQASGYGQQPALPGSYQAEISHMKNFITQRLEWLDAQAANGTW